MRPSDVADSLEEVAAVLLPLAKWIEARVHTPPLPEGTPEPLPWRTGGEKLTPQKLGVVRFLEGLFSETSQDAELKAYFSERAEEPLANCPFDDVNQWRSLRGLTADPAFAVIESDNMLMDIEGHPISRREFYDLSLPLFCAAVEAAKDSAAKLEAKAVSTQLSRRSFKDLTGWLTSINTSTDPVPDFIRYGLSRIELDPKKRTSGKDALKAAAGNPADDAAVRTFMRALGQLLKEQLLYDPDRATGVQLSRETQDGIATAGSLKGLDLQDFNWLFLHDVYPGAINKSGDLDWQKFVERLWSDSSPYWPRNLGRKSSTFLRQWGRDVLYAILGMRNPLPTPWDVAVLLELGERRRVGNKYTTQHAMTATDAFAKVFDKAMAEKKPTMAPQVASISVPAFGSPPVSPRQQQI